MKLLCTPDGREYCYWDLFSVEQTHCCVRVYIILQIYFFINYALTGFSNQFPPPPPMQGQMHSNASQQGNTSQNTGLYVKCVPAYMYVCFSDILSWGFHPCQLLKISTQHRRFSWYFFFIAIQQSPPLLPSFAPTPKIHILMLIFLKSVQNVIYIEFHCEIYIVPKKRKGNN